MTAGGPQRAPVTRSSWFLQKWHIEQRKDIILAPLNWTRSHRCGDTSIIWGTLLSPKISFGARSLRFLTVMFCRALPGAGIGSGRGLLWFAVVRGGLPWFAASDPKFLQKYPCAAQYAILAHRIGRGCTAAETHQYHLGHAP